MPIKATFRNAALVDAAPHVATAAKAEGLRPKKVEALWSALTDAERNGLIAHAKGEDASFAGWLAGFGSVFAELTEAEASALIRIAVTLAGGVIVEEDATGNETRIDTRVKAD